MSMVEAGTALCVPGNHDIKLMRKLRGKDVQITHGLADSLEQLDKETPEFRANVVEFIDDLVSHYVLDDGKLVVAHAGMREEMQGRGSAKVREFALYGETTGETDEFGLPVRYNWAAEYRGRATVVYGHTPVPQPDWLNRTINIDTGCVFGGSLTALRYPEKELVSVPAHATYAQPARPLVASVEPTPALTAQQTHDDLLDIDDVIGKRIVTTRLHHNVTRLGGSRSHESICGESEMAHLSAAHDVSNRNDFAAGTSRTSSGSFRLFSAGGCAARSLRGKAHGLAGRRDCVPRRGRSATTFRCGRGGCRDLLYAHRQTTLRPRKDREGVPGKGARRSGLGGILETIPDRLGLPRCGIDAVVRGDARIIAAAISAVGAAAQASLAPVEKLRRRWRRHRTRETGRAVV